MTPDILYEDKEILVCRKPAGIPVQSRNISTPDMVSILKNHIAASSRTPYLAVIHRLDQPVEGLLVFAKTPAAARNLNSQLTDAGFGKYYRALLLGIPSAPEADLEDYLVKDGRTNSSRICSPATPNAKKAFLHYKVLETGLLSGAPCSLAEITLGTGRHHQIRVQMSNLGAPIAGDRKYASSAVPFPTLQLFACRLTFLHPATKKPMEFKLPYLPHIPASDS